MSRDIYNSRAVYLKMNRSSADLLEELSYHYKRPMVMLVEDMIEAKRKRFEKIKKDLDTKI